MLQTQRSLKEEARIWANYVKTDARLERILRMKIDTVLTNFLVNHRGEKLEEIPYRYIAFVFLTKFDRIRIVACKDVNDIPVSDEKVVIGWLDVANYINRKTYKVSKDLISEAREELTENLLGNS